MTSPDSTRRTKQTRTFRRPFNLGKDEEIYPAGAYDIVTTEAVHEGNGRTVYVRTSTVLLVKSFGTTRHREIRPEDLEEAIRQDDRAWASGQVRV